VFPEVDGDGSQPEQLVRQADQAMYRAKNSGKNRLAFFSAADPESP
jgi:PleD family two-component response regulator